METAHRILVIEDSTTYLKILKTYLEREGYRVLTAETGEEGLGLVSRERPDLILCDFILPGMKGDELCKRVKLHSASRHIPLIMLTTRGEREHITTGLEAGADDYVVKSGDIDILMLRVRKFLSASIRTVPTPVPAEPAEPAVLRQQRVLTIDDDRRFREFITKLLTPEGYEVVQAEDGEAGLAAVQKHVFDLILVDLVMPGLMGDEVCRRLKTSEATREVPVILLTSRGDKHDMIAGLSAGADDYVVKTTDQEIIKSRVKAMIRRKFFQDENRRIQDELKTREIEAARVKAERDAAQEKARLADELAVKNTTLQATNRKLRDAQTALVQAEKMAALGQLVAGIAHEINNPLAFVYNNLVTIERDVRDLDRVLTEYRTVVAGFAGSRPDVIARLAELEDECELETARTEITTRVADAKEGLERVKKIVTNLRNFSRLDEGEVKTVDITEGIESTLKIIGHLVKDRITIERSYGEIPKVECFPGLLNQVFMNLLVNACQAIGDTGTITIRTYLENGSIRVSIVDTGCGIPQDLLQKIFDPFFTTKEVGQGTGLGLSTSYGIMQKHGGKILVDSAPGEGSTFTVVLFQLLPKQDQSHAQTQGP
ncbi:MAG: response regulator [Candidatus Riflebacteria bacterium]|nr:response regulator [Candidatus Riflebacteria bacterium]